MLKPVFQTILTLALLAWVLPTVSFLNWTALILASIVFTFLFSLIRPVLKILFLPVNIVTLGLFSALINVFLLWLVEYLVPGFVIKDMVLFGLPLSHFWTLVVLSMLIGFTGSVIRKIL